MGRELWGGPLDRWAWPQRAAASVVALTVRRRRRDRSELAVAGVARAPQRVFAAVAHQSVIEQRVAVGARVPVQARHEYCERIAGPLISSSGRGYCGGRYYGLRAHLRLRK